MQMGHVGGVWAILVVIRERTQKGIEGAIFGDGGQPDLLAYFVLGQCSGDAQFPVDPKWKACGSLWWML